jgi:hypothetical protein
MKSSWTLQHFLALGLIILGQYVVTMWVYHYGADVQMVSYTGFAGTLVSIILAVLAIVYSYFQTFAQQRDSHDVAEQVTKLRQVVEDTQRAQSAVADSAELLRTLGQKVDKAVTTAEASHVAIEGFKERIEALNVAKSERIATDIPTDLADQTGASLVEMAIPTQVCMYYLIVEAARRKLQIDTVVDEVLIPATLRKREDSPLNRWWVRGFFMATDWTLGDLGITRFELDDDDKLAIVWVHPAFEKAVLAAAEGSPVGNWFDLAHLREAFASLDHAQKK